MGQPFKFLQQLNDYSENDLVLKLADDFLASHFASLTIKSTHFVWSITLQNLNQNQKNLVCWSQHEKFYLLIKFEKIWDGHWLFHFFGSFDMEWPYCL